MAKDKISRKELLNQNDEFLTFSRKLLNTCIQYRYQVLGGLGVVLALVILILGVRYFSKRAEVQAYAQLDAVIQKYRESSQDKAGADVLKAAEAGFTELMNSYPGKNGADLGRIVFAGILLDAGESERAAKLYREALGEADRYPSLKPVIRMGLGNALEGTGDTAGAIQQFEDVVSDADNLMKPDAYFQLGRLYRAAGKNQEAAEAFRKIATDYPDSMFARIVSDAAGNG